jgi:citrate lyase subunit beta/citryl-CoA lyase
MVRVNSVPEHALLDLKAAAQARVAAVFLPKVEKVDEIHAAAYVLAPGKTKVVAMLESPSAVLEAVAISRAGAPLAGLVFGSEDYSSALGIATTGAALDWPAQMVSTAARARGLAAFGVPGPISGLDDLAEFTRLLEKAKAMGFTGCACIHPRQVAAANRVYSPSDREIALAREVVAAAEAATREGRGAFALHGRMIDAPIVEQARALLARIR